MCKKKWDLVQSNALFLQKWHDCLPTVYQNGWIWYKIELLAIAGISISLSLNDTIKYKQMKKYILKIVCHFWLTPKEYSFNLVNSWITCSYMLKDYLPCSYPNRNDYCSNFRSQKSIGFSIRKMIFDIIRTSAWLMPSHSPECEEGVVLHIFAQTDAWIYASPSDALITIGLLSP